MQFKTTIIFILQLSALISIEAQNNIDSTYRWEESDTTLRLFNGSYLIWQYNYNNRKGKPYFHPLNVKGINLTCESPSDHTWHLGLWFSWKFINGLNYWEYMNGFSTEETGYRSEGVTEIKETLINKNKDYSTNIDLNISYHPEGGSEIIKERRRLFISPPMQDGSYYIDYEFDFRATGKDVLLDRTPLPGEPGGQSWGGYAGLSFRFNQALKDSAVTIPDHSLSGSKSRLMYMGFKIEDDTRAGAAIFTNPENCPESTSWYITNNPAIPFIYFSPSVLYQNSISLAKDEMLRLKYRVWILPGPVSDNKLNLLYNKYLNK